MLLKERLQYLEGPLLEGNDRRWRGLLPAILLLFVLGSIDFWMDDAVLIGVLAIAPFLCAIVGARSATLAVSILAVAVAFASGIWNNNLDEADFWIRFGLVIGAAAFACYASWIVAENQRIAVERDEVARTLEQGLRPPQLPEIDGWSIAALYRATGDANTVGGDFYDVFRLERGWMVVIGDVTGHGARAASVTALARFTLRTSATLTGDPAEALSELNRTLIADQHGPLCTVVALTLGQRGDGEVRYAVAGHPPPLRVMNGTVEAINASGPVLGAFEESEWEVESLELERGEQLFLYTDGVTEARREDELFGQDRLAAAVGRASSSDEAVAKVDRAINGFTSGNLTDDTAILAITRSGAASARTR